ncbi:proline-rich protein 36 isoform X1 [Ischnura elegans]|uniref:proline-rich protein 36 isoform X1 n=1 Tax=Ischnura elegans TaxID=197161 RepID=UPI001ED88DCA|nr:proline-rich protein 36 isoform X1 [Ischnura elegans]
MAWFDTGEAMGALNALGRDANNFIKRTIEEIEKDLSRVEVNVGAPGIRFGQSRSGNSAGTSEGGSSAMGSETKGPVKKAMACEGCSTKFSFMRRKQSLAWIRWDPYSSRYNSAGLRECLECRRLYCTQCLPKALPVSGSGSGGWCSRERRQTTCSKCLILLAHPPSRTALMGLRTRDLQAFLASRKIPTHGCLEKDDLVNLVVQLSNYEANDPRVGPPPGSFQPHLGQRFPPFAEPERRPRDDLPPPWNEGDGATPGVHSRSTRSEGHTPSPTSPSEPSNTASSPTRISPQGVPHPSSPGGGEGASSTMPPSMSSSQPNLVPEGGSQQQVPPSNPGASSLPDEGDWVMIDVEERVLPPYGSGQPNPPAHQSTPPATTAEENPSEVPPVTASEGATPSSPRTESSVPPTVGVERIPSPPMDVAGATSNMSGSTPEVNLAGLPEPGDMGGNGQASFFDTQSPSLNRPSASVSQGSSPSKSAGSFLTPRDIASNILSSTKSEDDLSTLSVKQLKELLTSSRVDYRGCCEKRELLERAQRLWREYKASQENLTDDTMCKVCMDACIDCVMLECGHMATCTPCGKRMSECPICRQYVVRIVRTFKA